MSNLAIIMLVCLTFPGPVFLGTRFRLDRLENEVNYFLEFCPRYDIEPMATWSADNSARHYVTAAGIYLMGGRNN